MNTRAIEVATVLMVIIKFRYRQSASKRKNEFTE